jgi:hypothetical protein
MIITERQNGATRGRERERESRRHKALLSLIHSSLLLDHCYFHLQANQISKSSQKGKERWHGTCSFHFKASEVEHGAPQPQEVAALALRALGQPQATAEAEAGLPLHRLHGLVLARRADAEVQVEVGALERLPLSPVAAVVLRLVAGERRHLRLLSPEHGGLVVPRCRLERDGYVGGVLVDRPVGHRVDPPAQQLPPDVRVPVVLDLVVRPPRQPTGNQGPSV